MPTLWSDCTARLPSPRKMYIAEALENGGGTSTSWSQLAGEFLIHATPQELDRNTTVHHV